MGYVKNEGKIGWNFGLGQPVYPNLRARFSWGTPSPSEVCFLVDAYPWRC